MALASSLAARVLEDHRDDVAQQNALLASRTQLRLSLARSIAAPEDERATAKIEKILRDAHHAVPDLLGLYVLGPDRRVRARVTAPSLPGDLEEWIRVRAGDVSLDLRDDPRLGLIERTHTPLVLDTEEIGLLVVVARAEPLVEALDGVRAILGDRVVVRVLDRASSVGGGSPRELLRAGFAEKTERGGATRWLTASRRVDGLPLEVRVEVDPAELRALVHKSILLVALALLLSTTVLALATTLALEKLTRPLLRLTDWTTARLSGADLPPPDSNAYREVRMLAESLDRLTRESEDGRQQLERLVSALPCGVIVTDDEGRIVLFNRQAETLFGHSAVDLLGEEIEGLVPEAHREAHRVQRRRFAKDPTTRVMGVGRDVQAVRKDGSCFDVEISLMPIHTAGAHRTVVAISDISSRKEREMQLLRSSETDELTGLRNRRYMKRRLEEEIRRASRQRETLGVMMIDVDRFKRLNDSAGHASGDACLARIATVLTHHFQRTTDFCIRFGGEEFIAVCYGRTPDDLVEHAERLRQAIEHEGIPNPGLGPDGTVSVSIGVASRLVDRATTADGLLELADRALYRAKEAGRNRVELLEDDPHAEGRGAGSET